MNVPCIVVSAFVTVKWYIVEIPMLSGLGLGYTNLRYHHHHGVPYPTLAHISGQTIFLTSIHRALARYALSIAMPKFLDPSSYYVKNSFSEVPGEEFILEGGFEKVKAAIEKAKAASKKMASGIPTSTEPRHVGPHPSFVKVAQPFITEQKLREYMANTGVTEAKEDSMRLQGVSWIDGVRKKLLLYLFTSPNCGLFQLMFSTGQRRLSIRPWCITISSAFVMLTMSTTLSYVFESQP